MKRISVVAAAGCVRCATFAGTGGEGDNGVFGERIGLEY